MIQAKEVIPDQYWILRDQERKIGNIEATNNGYAVNLYGESVQVQTLSMLKQRLGDVEFEATQRQPSTQPTNSVHGFPTKGLAHNAMFDVKHQLPLWTTDPRSRSWLAAGWYRVRRNGRDWRVMFCPKLIILQRYEFQGPFHSSDEARAR
jgi:hypothetical protein